MIIEYILRIIGTKRIWNYLLKNASFIEEDDPGSHYWQMAFNRVPELKKWMKAREIQLLRSSILNDRTSDFVKGQIFEIRLLQHFDIPSDKAIPKVEAIKPIMPDKNKFLSGWNKNGSKNVGRAKEKDK